VFCIEIGNISFTIGELGLLLFILIVLGVLALLSSFISEPYYTLFIELVTSAGLLYTPSKVVMGASSSLSNHFA